MLNRDIYINKLEHLKETLSEERELDMEDRMCLCLVTSDFTFLYNLDELDYAQHLSLVTEYLEKQKNHQITIVETNSDEGKYFTSSKTYAIYSKNGKLIVAFYDITAIALSSDDCKRFSDCKCVEEILVNLNPTELARILNQTNATVSTAIPTADNSWVTPQLPKVIENSEDLLAIIDQYDSGILKFKDDYVIIYIDASDEIHCYSFNTTNFILKPQDPIQIIDYFLDI